MNADLSAPRPFRLIAERSGPRFLGLPVAERNRRVARRGGAVGEAATATTPTLEVPSDVAITPALIRALPPPVGVTELVWHPDRPPLVWRSADARASEVPRVVRLPDDAVLDVSTGATRHQSAWRLLRSSGKPTDGWLSRHLHRKVSRVFSYVFLRLGLSANLATLLTFGIGATGAWLMAQTSHLTMIGGALLYWCSSMADGIDGEVARLTLSDTPFGEQLDTGVDQATHLLTLAGAGIGWWRQGIGAAGLALAVAVASGLPLALLWAMAMIRRAQGSRQFFVATKPIEIAVARAARNTGAPPLRIAAATFVLFRRETVSLTIFLVALATGQRAVYLAIVAAGLGIVAVTFLIYLPLLNETLQSAVDP